MQLTTPENREYDTVFPGENWFFYWRTSPSLWENKLAEFQGRGVVFAPVFWGLHSDGQGQSDFGLRRPETDLKRLFECARAAGKEIAFLLPVSPAPFLPNGGLPSSLARTMAQDDQGMARSALDSDGRLNKLFSFFDPRVFQAFRGFAMDFARFMSENAVACEVYGADCFYAQGRKKKAFFSDSSPVFERGFARYLARLREEGNLPMAARDDVGELEKLKDNYHEQIKDLYRQAAGEALAANWSGTLDFGFVGSSPEDLFARTSVRWERPGGFFPSFLQMLALDLAPSSVLLGSDSKRGPLGKALGDAVTESFIRSKTQSELYEEEHVSGFTPLVFFELIGADRGAEAFEGCGLVDYLERQYPWCYRILEDLDLEEEETWEGKIRFFSGARLDGAGFKRMLKLFMSGSPIFLDVAGLPEDLERKLELFVLENDLKAEKLNYISPIAKIKLGEGSVITFRSDKLEQAPLAKKLNFWDTLVSGLNVRKLDAQAEEGVYYFWSSRASNPYELNYEEVRRVSLYNTTSYKKKARIVSAKNFAFLKTIDEKNASAKSTPIGIDLQLLPGGSVSLDFGYYE